jgi:tetratricopeptide (TPR) repeat protein
MANSRLVTGMALAGIVLLGLALRVSYLREIVHAPDFSLPQVDAGFYDYWARGLVTGDWTVPKNLSHFPDPEVQTNPYFRPPGYPFFLALVYSVTGGSYLAARGVQMGLGLLNCLLAYLLGKTLFGRGVGLLFALLLSVYWGFIYFEGQLLAPVLLVTAGLLLLYTLSLWPAKFTFGRALAGGLAFGLYAVIRANVLLFAPVVLGWAWWLARRRRDGRSVGLTWGTFALGAAAVIAPVTIRNYVVAQDVVLVASNAGINLYVGNNEDATGRYSIIPNLQELGVGDEWTCFDYPRIVHGVEQQTGRTMKHSEVSSWFAGKAFAYMRAHPGHVLKLMATKAALFWGPVEVPNNKVISYEKADSWTLRYMPGFPVALGLAVFGLIQFVVRARKRLPQPAPETASLAPSARQIEVSVLIVLFVFVYFASYLPFFVSGRYRIPVIPFLLLFGAYGLHQGGCLIARRQYRTEALWLALLVGLCAAASIRLIPYEPNAAHWHLVRATCYRLTDRPDLAITECRAAIRARPDQEKGHRRLADLLLLQRNYAEAIEHYEQAAQLAPGRFDVQCNLGLAYSAGGHLDRAVDHFRAALQIQPEMAEIHYRLATVLQRKGQGEDAIDHLRQAIELKPDYVQAHRKLAMALLSRREFDEATTQLRRLLDRHPNDPSVHNLLGIALKSSGNVDQAVEHYRQALKLKPDHYQAHNNLANALLAQGRPDEAIVHYQQALQIKPDYAEAKRNLEHVLRLKDQPK